MIKEPQEAITAQEREREALARLAALLQAGAGVRYMDATGEISELPPSALAVLQRAVPHLIQGEEVEVFPAQTDLSTNEAADLLNVSRPYLIKLLEEGEIPYFMIGTHRRMHLTDVLEYQQKRAEQRRRGMEELVRLSEELGLYDNT